MNLFQEVALSFKKVGDPCLKALSCMHTACVWCGLRSSRTCFYNWRIRLTALLHFYSNADHTRRIRKGPDVTKSDACAQKTHSTHAVCIQL